MNTDSVCRDIIPASINTRKPQRITFTINYLSYTRLIDLSMEEGRSLSNLVAHIIERALETR